MEYAIVDIETTGGNAASGSIIEIAIRISDGDTIVDSYETLLKPSHCIPPYITSLTGIDEAMVKDCMPFNEVAKKIFLMLEGRIFVAHNVNFDYSFVRYHLKAAGYNYAAQKLCTIKMAMKIKPWLPSYSLSNLCETLNIKIENRHRAGGDTDATMMLFLKLREWDTEGIIQVMLNENIDDHELPPELSEDFDGLPSQPGVYYFYNNKGDVIYIGKAKDLKRRVAQHFKVRNVNRKPHFIKEIARISYESCGTELMAFIQEALEIKRLHPQYNTALKKYEPKAGLFVYEDEHGYQRMIVSKSKKGYIPVQVFTTHQGGINKLRELVRRFGLCSELCRLKNCELCDLVNKSKNLLCTANQPLHHYNQKVAQAVSFLKEDTKGFYIVDRGRNVTEKSCIWVENGQFYGMGYIDNNADIYSLEDVKDCLTPYAHNHYIMQLIISYVCKYPGKVVPIIENVQASWQ